MPYLDVLGVIERINDLHINKKPQFIRLSAVGHCEIAQKALTLGSKSFLIKPFNMSKIAKRIKQFSQ